MAISLDRQRRSIAVSALIISEATLSNWMIKATDYIKPVIELLREDLMNPALYPW